MRTRLGHILLAAPAALLLPGTAAARGHFPADEDLEFMVRYLAFPGAAAAALPRGRFFAC